jgi:Ni,Fe-hydrogenase III large subunit
MEEERVVGVEPVLGYVHRGLERLAETRDYQQMVYVVERVCGICSFMHAMAYSMGLEELMGLTVPDRARYLRVVWAELHRLHSHLLWAGLFADALGFESLFMQLWRAREIILDLLEKTAGNRIIISTAMVGGVRRDIPPELAAEVLAGLDRLERELERVAPALTKESTVLRRTRGKGVFTPELVRQYGVVGPAARATGLRDDVRAEGYAAYGDLDFQPVVEEGGDVLARCTVRLRECFQSIGLVRQALARLPEGPLAVKVTGPVPEGEVVVRVEQPRGEVLYYIQANGTPKLSRLRVRTPTFANLPALFALLPGHELADVPVLLTSIDPCISCTER